MESRRKRKSSQIFKWVCYTLLMLLCTVLQTMPGLFQLGAAKPLYLLPLALAVSVFEGEFAGAIFGAVCGLMWDYTAGRTVGCRPVFPFRYPFLAAVQEVDLVKPLPVAHLHDFALEIFHSGVGAAVLAALPCVG